MTTLSPGVEAARQQPSAAPVQEAPRGRLVPPFPPDFGRRWRLPSPVTAATPDVDRLGGTPAAEG